MIQVKESIEIDADPAAVWAVCGDPGTSATWIPAVSDSRLEGDLRSSTLGDDGGVVVERILQRSEESRSYAYEFVSGPVPLREYRSMIIVEAAGSRTRVNWDAELEASDPAVEEELTAGIRATYRSGLEALKRRLESV